MKKDWLAKIARDSISSCGRLPGKTPKELDVVLTRSTIEFGMNRLKEEIGMNKLKQEEEEEIN